MSWWMDSPADVDALHQTAVDYGMTVSCPPRTNRGVSESSTCAIPTGTCFASVPVWGEQKTPLNPVYDLSSVRRSLRAFSDS